MVIFFGANRRKLTYPPLFCELAVHNRWENRNKDAGVNTADDLITCSKNLVNFGLVTPVFCRRVCTGQAILGLETHF